MVQLSHPYMTTRKTIILTRRTFVDKVMSLLFSTLSRLFIAFLLRSKPNLDQKKVMVTVWWSAASLIRQNFLNPSETITSEKYAQQITEMHWQLQCLQLALVSRKGPILRDNAWPHVTQPMLQKLNELGYDILPHPPCFPDVLPTNPHFFKHLDNYLQGKYFHNQQKAENALQEFIQTWSMGFYTTGIKKLISRWQKCADCSDSYFD